MDIIKLTRKLGAAIQQDDRYAKFQAAQKANEEDKDLNDLMGKIQLVHMSYQHEASISLHGLRTRQEAVTMQQCSLEMTRTAMVSRHSTGF